MDRTQFNPQDPNALFSPDQWLNRFSNYNNAPLPWPSTFYTGTPAGSMPPTDAMGQPIQSFLDMQAKHDAWRPPASAAPASSAPMGTDPNFGLENMWLAANHQPIQLAPTRTPGVLGPQSQAALDAMNAASGAAGAPDAQGQGQAPAGQAPTVPGTTLNSTPGQPASAPGATAQQSPYPSLATMNSLQRNQALAGYSPTTGQPEANGTDALFNRQFAAFGSGAPQQRAAPAAAAGPTNPFDMHQAYLDALSMPQGNRGLITPGATVPAGPSAQPGPGSLQSFLANWKPAQSGPGSGFQQGFGNTLRGMGY